MISPTPRLVVAVTGHRDIWPESVPAIAAKVSAALDGLLAKAGGAGGILMLNALAIGGDSLVFDVAEEKGIPIGAVLPLPVDAYAMDFAEGDERAAFYRRLGRCRHIWQPEVSLPRPECYAALAGVLVRHADVLLALWDGSAKGEPGGTAAVVKMAATGSAPRFRPDWMALPFAERTCIERILVRVRRARNL